MPYIVNGQTVPEELIRQEFGRIGRDPEWQRIPDLNTRTHSLRAAAEQCAQERILLDQAAANDPRPIDPAALEQEVARQRAQWGCRTGFDQNAEFERAMLRERTKVGLDAAREEGRIGGRRPKLSDQQQSEIRKIITKGDKTAADAARLFKVHPATVSRLLARASSRKVSRAK